MENRNRFGLDKMNDELVNDILPVEINLPKNQKNLLATLIYINGIDKKDKDGFFYVDNKYLMEVLGVSEPTIISNANKLIEEGFIQRVTGKKNHPSKYLVTDLIKEYTKEYTKKYTKEYTKKYTKEYTKKYTKNFSKNFSKTVENFSQDKDIDKEKDKEYIFNIINNIIKENNINLINNINYIIKKEKENLSSINENKEIKEIGTMREPNVELMINLIKSIESIKESLQLMNSTMNENFNKLINKIDSFLDSSDKVNDTEDTLGNDTNSSSESESVEEQSNLESESAEDEIKDDSNNESEPIEPETTSNNKPSTIEKEKEKGCAEREKETTEELPNGAIQFTTSVDLEKYIAQNKLSSLENWGKYKIDIDNLVIVPTEMTQEANKSNPEPSNDAGGIVDHTEENKPNLPIPNEPTEDELKFEKRKQKAKELVSRLINEHMTNEQEFNEYFNKGFMWCKKFQLETYYVKLVEKYKPDVDTTEVEEEYALNDIFSNAA